MVLEPTLDEFGSFYIENGADKLKFLEYPTGPLKDKSPIKFSYHRPSQDPSTFKWIFEEINVSSQLDASICELTFANKKNLNVCANINDTISKTRSILDTQRDATDYTLECEIIKNKDSSYFIKAYGKDLYLHVGHDNQEKENTVIIGEYNSNYEEAYKWMILPTDKPDIYQIFLYNGILKGHLHLADTNKVSHNKAYIKGPYKFEQ